MKYLVTNLLNARPLATAFLWLAFLYNDLLVEAFSYKYISRSSL
jgi:hypothetical protein